jgi:hypothetical protein
MNSFITALSSDSKGSNLGAVTGLIDRELGEMNRRLGDINRFR